jgi:hypothetical protein
VTCVLKRNLSVHSVQCHSGSVNSTARGLKETGQKEETRANLSAYIEGFDHYMGQTGQAPGELDREMVQKGPIPVRDVQVH